MKARRIGNAAALAAFAALVTAGAVRAEEDTDAARWSAFRTALAGSWVRVPAPPLSDFAPVAVRAARSLCTNPAALALRFEERDGILLRAAEGGKRTIVLAGKRGERRASLDAWLLMTNEGPEAVLHGRIEAGGKPASILMTDVATFLRCPEAEASGKGSD